MQLNSKLKKSALTGKEKFEDVITSQIVQMKDEEKIFISDYNSLIDYYNRVKLSKFNNLLKKCDVLLEIFKYTFDGRKFLYHEGDLNNDNGFYIFTTIKI
ncbi:hypothetical protein DMUE_3823 [Dictyocoela muelleri]|nr:hypothetical protein DMUE_3823 [Dictyocoela muelleri]